MRTVHKRPDDAGMTMIDVVVSMTIMTVFLTMFTTGILQIYRGGNKTEAIANAQSQLNTAFIRLDKEIRYATGISDPNSTADAAGDYYVEYLTSNTGTAVCTELRLRAATKQLQRRTWVQGASPMNQTAWIPIVGDVSGTAPFDFQAADSTSNFQRLRIVLTATVGLGTYRTTKTIDVMFTALNTSLATDSSTVCTEGRSVP